MESSAPAAPRNGAAPSDGAAPGDAAAPMTAEQRRRFEEDGFLLVPGALGPDEVAHYRDAVDATYARAARSGGLAADGSLHRLSATTHCPPLAGLLAHPATFPLVWSVMGWNVHVTHSHVDVHPPLPEAPPFRWRWHQDGGRQNIDVETDPRPRLSVFVAYWLSDVSEGGRGNFTVVPGSHRLNWLPGPPAPTVVWPTPPGAVEITGRPGDAVFYDRRLWHVRADNRSRLTRKAVFFGYTYRWIAIRDDVAGLPTQPWYAELDPVQRQLLGDGDGTGDHRWGHAPDQVPLYRHLATNGLLDPTNRPHKRLFP